MCTTVFFGGDDLKDLCTVTLFLGLVGLSVIAQSPFMFSGLMLSGFRFRQHECLSLPSPAYCRIVFIALTDF